MNNLAKNSDDFARLEMINGKIIMMSPRPRAFSYFSQRENLQQV